MALQWFQVTGAAYGFLGVGLAILLLYLGFHHRANRAYSFLQFQLAIPALLLGAWRLASDGPTPALIVAVGPYFNLLNFVTIVYFLMVFPGPRTRFFRSRWAFVPFLMVMAALDLAYALDHRLWTDPSVTAEGPFGTMTQPGPLQALRLLASWIAPLVGLVLARDYVRLPPGPVRQSVLLVALGIPLLAMYQSFGGAVSRAVYGTPTDGTPFAWYADLQLVTDVVRVAVILGTMAYLARHALRGADAEVRRGARVFLGGVVLAALVMNAAQLALAGGNRTLSGQIGAFLTTSFLIAADLLVVYALLKYELFDIQVKVRFAIKQSTVAAAFIGVFFVVSEGASSYFATSLGPMLGIAAAGALVFAIAPLQHAAERLANAAVPDARAHAELSTDERARFYREHARLAWKDGVLTGDERDLLDHARERLGLSHEEAARLEREVRAELGAGRMGAGA